MSLERLTREPAGEAEGALVLLHGRGVDEHDLFPLLDILDPRKRLLGVTPGAPLSFPPGPGKHWYARIERAGYPDAVTFGQTFLALAELVDGLGVPPERTIVGGFSQGGVMAYALGLDASRELPAGVLALSSFFPDVAGWAPREALPAGFPVAIGHGTRDKAIRVEHAHAARDRLRAAGADVTYHESDTGHTIDPRFLASLPDWVDRALTPR